jgi:hypothetical protein
VITRATPTTYSGTANCCSFCGDTWATTNRPPAPAACCDRGRRSVCRGRTGRVHRHQADGSSSRIASRQRPVETRRTRAAGVATATVDRRRPCSARGAAPIGVASRSAGTASRVGAPGTAQRPAAQAAASRGLARLADRRAGLADAGGRHVFFARVLVEQQVIEDRGARSAPRPRSRSRRSPPRRPARRWACRPAPPQCRASGRAGAPRACSRCTSRSGGSRRPAQCRSCRRFGRAPRRTRRVEVPSCVTPYSAREIRLHVLGLEGQGSSSVLRHPGALTG